ncbi:hypothetical protein ACLB1Q_00630 [Escherichia coli]
MTVDEKIGQLRLISVGPDNPKEAIREMIKDGQVGAIFNTVTRQDIRAVPGSGDGIKPPENSSFLCLRRAARSAHGVTN